MNSWIGFLTALYVSSHIIKTILNVDIHFYAMAFILLTFSYKSFFGKKNILINFKKNQILLLISFTCLILYALITAILFHNGSSLNAIVEIILVSMFFFIGKSFNKKAFKSFFIIIITLSIIQSLFLIYNRSYIYHNLDNYLLVTLVSGAVTSILYMLLFDSDYKKYRYLFFIFFVAGIFSILNMQARTTALFILIFSFLSPLILLKTRKSILFYPLIGGAFYFSRQYLLNIYNESILANRMESLFYNFGNERRFDTFSQYIKGMKYNWLTGFGSGQSSMGIYGIENDYPHNFILEFLSEFGLIGLLFIITFIFYTLYRKKVYTQATFIYFKMSYIFFIYMFSMFSKSFGIYDSYLLFLGFGFLWSFDNSKIQKELQIA
jgi:hypothetical protein